MLAPWKKSAKKQRYYFANRGPSSQIYGFSISYVRMQELDCKDGWAVRNSWFWTVVLKKTLECLLDCKEIQPVNSKGNKTWIFIRRTDAEAEAPILWPPDGKSLLFGKDPDAGKYWRQEERGWQRMRWLDGITDSVNMLLFTQLSLTLCDTWLPCPSPSPRVCSD